jgi:hypothetical protein
VNRFVLLPILLNLGRQAIRFHNLHLII